MGTFHVSSSTQQLPELVPQKTRERCFTFLQVFYILSFYMIHTQLVSVDGNIGTIKYVSLDDMVESSLKIMQIGCTVIKGYSAIMWHSTQKLAQPQFI